LPQFSGCRARRGEKSWRLWHAEQDPREPSRLMRPMPVFGQVPSWNFGRPFASFSMAATASRLLGRPFSSGLKSSTVSIPPFVDLRPTLLPWHCWQPTWTLAIPLTWPTDFPGVGVCGSNITREPSTVSARKLSSEARISPARAWWLFWNSFDSGVWQRPQSRGVITVAIVWP
jgi:hypothetical protein